MAQEAPRTPAPPTAEEILYRDSRYGCLDGIGLSPLPPTPCRPARNLGPARSANLLDGDPSAGRSKRPQDLVERHIRSRPLDFGHTGLAGLDAASQLCLGQLLR